MSTAKSSGKKRVSESEASKMGKLKRVAIEDDFDLDLSRWLSSWNQASRLRVSSFRPHVLEGFEYLKESCSSVLTKLLQYIARISKHSAIDSSHGNKAFLDGSDLNGRHVKHLQ
ncbi:hypothetical protein RHMOL_Rhmol11G0210100 [Rhododendron molle]|uniref:Uncharacterized protein n=1 Tax=Rhododendron molle TaxID=49168 RepID=A0ACC0LVK0_RHOML|nr:hypothetical protein RHMOL_Rhmol11G0210100 [Rhododendron molle]